MLSRLVTSVSSALDLNAATLSGCIDVVVVPQLDGTLRSTPFHVRFGKAKVLRCSGREVRILVNSVLTDIRMKLGPAGKAFFEIPLEEEEEEEGQIDEKGRLVPGVERRTRLEEDLEARASEERAARELAAEGGRGSAGGSVSGPADVRVGAPPDETAPLPRVELSMCGHMLDGASDPGDLFEQNRVEYESLNRDPEMWFHPSLVCRFVGGNALYPGKVALPLLGSLHAFGRALEPAAVDRLAMLRVTAEPAAGDPGVLAWAFGSPTKAATTARDERPTAGAMRHSLRPSAAQLRRLNLKSGPNSVTFQVESPLQGTQAVSGTIYLWPANSKIIVSDVDGTITRSDVLGQLLPIMGRDWSHAGVAELFMCCRRNNYRILYLTARAIGQADATRDFLFGLRQSNGAYLPDGPLLMSPDRLFPSFKREVIDRKPFVFKIAALKDVRLLFPRTRNPYYAGFGNRDTDHRSYVHVGVPEARVFIIDTKGAVHHINSSFARTYTSMTEIVHFMFPPVPHAGGDSALEQELAEEAEYNDTNYWSSATCYAALGASFSSDEADEAEDKPEISPPPGGEEEISKSSSSSSSASSSSSSSSASSGDSAASSASSSSSSFERPPGGRSLSESQLRPPRPRRSSAAANRRGCCSDPG